jgi:hypothetical protein
MDAVLDTPVTANGLGQDHRRGQPTTRVPVGAATAPNFATKGETAPHTIAMGHLAAGARGGLQRSALARVLWRMAVAGRRPFSGPPEDCNHLPPADPLRLAIRGDVTAMTSIVPMSWGELIAAPSSIPPGRGVRSRHACSVRCLDRHQHPAKKLPEQLQ